MFLLTKNPDMLSSEDIGGVSSRPLNFNYHLFAENLLLDISLLKIQDFDMTDEEDLPKVPPLSDTARIQVLLELMQVSKSL